MPFSLIAQNLIADALDESAASGVKYVGVHALTDPGTGATANAGEVTGGSPAYARQAITLGAAAAGQKSNTAQVVLDVPAGTYGFLTLWNAASGNSGTQYLGHIPLGGALAIKGFGTVDPTLANDQILAPGHGMSDGDRVLVFNTFGGALATGLTEGTVYYVASATANSFKLATTAGGSAVDITAVGNGTLFYQRVVPEQYNAQGQLVINAGQLVLDFTAV